MFSIQWSTREHYPLPRLQLSMAPRNVLFNFHHIEEVHESYARFRREETFKVERYCSDRLVQSSYCERYLMRSGANKLNADAQR